MRCATLAEAWRAAGLGTAVVHGDIALPFVRRRLAQAGIPVADAGAALAASDVLLVDSYDADVRQGGADQPLPALRALVDDGEGPVPSGYDVVWNPNPWSDAAAYAGRAPRVLAGAGHVPVRSGLPAWRGGASRDVGVTLGGGASGLAARQAFAESPLGSSGLRFCGPEAWAPPGWRTYAADAMCECAVLVTAAGTTLWEAGRVGIPTVAVVLADNQAPSAEWVRAAGVPVVDARGASAATLAAALHAAIAAARPVPPVADGAPVVARALAAAAVAGSVS
jgi:spore coat polysaccharide biosynthesis predicted glycosyltransferase SpsG